eukprot:CAMPEP_0175057512 /NCGR_PEP_ID=MMETSP0052_2-20121109/11303_1 /TAXON_ID=51329 ORGANISM="Polytomella parva, Strain SAG 63-3" /NCGR_SAMPLE_ID=MMETSP0052_2 /ASSEMBLY_ACC=CAM_ASM_000194 /LENGTH=387 /DNA_ID=CAMNT_0016322729 /DNA_START=65 /DNA_END=1228 /DNA_ORIENTATION=-
MPQEFAEKYNNYRNESRNKYWCEPPSYMPGAYPGGGLPNHQEVLRTESVRKEIGTSNQSLKNYSPYMSKFSKTQSLTQSLDRRLLASDPRVQDWASATGVRRSLPTNIIEAPRNIHVNNLRFERDVNYTGALPVDGGRSYDSNVCISNWVEERRDRKYGGVYPPRDSQCAAGTLYPTEYSHRYTPTSQAYREKLSLLYSLDPNASVQSLTGTAGKGSGGGSFGSAPLRTQSVDSKSRTGGSCRTGGGCRTADEGQLINYAADGFGVSPFQDHTAESKRGGFWVGTAPYGMYESVSRTSTRRGVLEFQQRCASEDPRSKILINSRPLTELTPTTQKVRENMLRSQANSGVRNLKSNYAQDFRDFTAAARAGAAEERGIGDKAVSVANS